MEKLGVGIVGTGWVSAEYIRAFKADPRTEVRAIVSREKERAHAKAEEFTALQQRARLRTSGKDAGRPRHPDRRAGHAPPSARPAGHRRGAGRQSTS